MPSPLYDMDRRGGGKVDQGISSREPTSGLPAVHVADGGGCEKGENDAFMGDSMGCDRHVLVKSPGLEISLGSTSGWFHSTGGCWP